MAIADLIAALAIGLLAVWFLRMAVRLWRQPDELSPLYLAVSGIDRAVLMLGLFVGLMAVGIFGDGLRLLDKQSLAAAVVFVTGGAGMLLFAFLFASVYLFNWPKFLVPPHLRHLPGTLTARRRGGGHSRQ